MMPVCGEMPWAQVDAWRKDLHRDFERALTESKLHERPDYEAANEFLLMARRQQAGSIELQTLKKPRSGNWKVVPTNPS